MNPSNFYRVGVRRGMRRAFARATVRERARQAANNVTREHSFYGGSMHMTVGCVKEIKKSEFRVGMTPANAAEYARHGHRVLVEAGLGEGSGFSDEEYLKAGAALTDAERVWAESDMLIKVKEPLEAEYPRMRRGQILYTYLHLAADRALTRRAYKVRLSRRASPTRHSGTKRVSSRCSSP